jgi:hypothetical protein
MGLNETPLSLDQLLGRGELYVAPYNSSGVLTAEWPMGNVTRFEPTIQPETVRIYDSTDAAGGLLQQATIRQSSEFALEGTSLNRKTLEFLLSGDGSALANTVGSVVNEVPPVAKVLKGAWFPLTRRNVSAVTVTGPSGTPTYSGTTDYKVDGVTGRIKVLETGTIADGAALEVDYTSGADTSKTVRALTQGKIECMARFIPNPTTGRKFEVEIWRALLTLDGGFSLIGEEFSRWTAKLAVISDAAVHPSEPYFRIIER